jgi:hypothetical protein
MPLDRSSLGPRTARAVGSVLGGGPERSVPNMAAVQTMSDPVGDMLERMDELVRDGLRHGFFEFTITCETGQGRRREVLIRAGKSERFVIPEEALS